MKRSEALVSKTKLQRGSKVTEEVREGHTLNDIDPSNAVPGRNGVRDKEELQRVRDGLLPAFVLQLDGETLLEVQCEVLRGIGSLQRVRRKLPHVLRRRDVRIFQD